jgi:SNF2 family DNA or RNA helicase
MQLTVSSKHQVIGAPVRPDLETLFPDAKKVTLAGNELMMINHGYNETKLLRNMGFEVPAPIISSYNWEGGTPFDVQIKTAALLTMSRRAYVLNGMGTGKTKAALWSWRYLNRMGLAKKLLVVAPLSTLNFTWAKEVFTTLPGVPTQVLIGTKEQRLKKLGDTNAMVYIINHDGLAIIGEALKARPDIDTVVLDELAAYRNARSIRAKTTRKIVERMLWAWGMTGSPTPNAPTDAWGQCMMLTPQTVPSFFKRFQEEVMFRISQFKYVPKNDAAERVFSVMQPAVRFTLDDVVELPELVERTVDIALGAKQQKVYNEMVRQASAMVASHEITGVNAGAVLSKLLQISTGYVYTSKREIVALDNQLRLDALVDAVDATDRKVIVFAPFKHALAGIMEKLTKAGYDVAEVSGDTPMKQRDEIFTMFQNTNKIKVLVAHPKCMSHGLTLTNCNTIVWFAPLPDLEIFQQANARIRRYGQKHKQLVLMFQSTPVEKKIYAKLRAKESIQSAILDLFAEASV